MRPVGRPSCPRQWALDSERQGSWEQRPGRERGGNPSAVPDSVRGRENPVVATGGAVDVTVEIYRGLSASGYGAPVAVYRMMRRGRDSEFSQTKRGISHIPCVPMRISTDSPSELTVLAGRELERLLADKLFRRSESLQRLLRLLVERALAGERVTEVFLAERLLGLSPQEFHPYTNSHVRVNVSLLRKRLGQFYQRDVPGEVKFLLPRGEFSLRIEAAGQREKEWKRLLSQARLLGDSRYIEELAEAARLYERVLEEKPDFGPALGGLAGVHLSMAGNGAPPGPSVEMARAAGRRGLALALESWEAVCGAAAVAGLCDHDWEEALRLYDRALGLAGNLVVADPWFQASMLALGRTEELLRQMEGALGEFAMTPRGLQQNYGICLHLAGRFGEAEVEFQRTTVLFPDDFSVWIWLAMQHWLSGERERVSEALEKGIQATRGRMPGQLLAEVGRILREPDGEWAGPRDGSAADFGVMVAEMMRDRPEEALAALGRMLSARNPVAFVLLRSPLASRLAVLSGYGRLFGLVKLRESGGGR